MRSPADNPSTSEGAVLTVEFTLAGQPFMGLNGGPQFPFTEAVSFSIDCEDQAEVDRLWDALTADGGKPVQCGWLKDRYGLSWQIVPKAMARMLAGPDKAAREAGDAGDDEDGEARRRRARAGLSGGVKGRHALAWGSPVRGTAEPVPPATTILGLSPQPRPRRC